MRAVPTVAITCSVCGTTKQVKPWAARQRSGAFCSHQCAATARSRPIAERFWEKVSVGAVAECWPWQGAASEQGYGSIWNGTKNVPAHRVSYELSTGPIGVGLEIDHLCRNPACVNPAHLEPVTKSENQKRGLNPARLRAVQKAKTHCPKGHAYAGDNLYTNPTTGARYCKKCTELSRMKYRIKILLTGPAAKRRRK